jgi:hypothetical protein
MIHELRIYHVAPAKMPALLERFEKSTLASGRSMASAKPGSGRR